MGPWRGTPRPPAHVAVLGAVVALAVLVGGAAPVRAGGSWLDPVLDRYEPGDTATLVGYVGPGQLGWVEDGPFLAYLRAGDAQPSGQPFSDQGTPLGPLTVEPVSEQSFLRVSLSFALPDALPPGLYTVAYCNDPCTNGLGDLMGGRLSVGMDPPKSFARSWLLDEPEIANLAPDARITGPGYDVTADQVRSGSVPPPILAPPPAPPAPPTAVAPVPATTVAPSAPPPVAPSAAPAPPRADPSPDEGGSDRWFVILGSALAAVCTLSVLAALRAGPSGPRPPSGATEELQELEPLAAGRPR